MNPQAGTEGEMPRGGGGLPDGGAEVPAHQRDEDAKIVVKGLGRRYGDLVAVRDLSFTVRAGEMFGLIGPDGAGKTTTLRIVLGLLRAGAGSVRTCGLDPYRERAALSRRVGYFPQRFSLYGDLTVDENISFFASVHGVHRWKPRRDRILEVLRLVPFRRRLADRLSGGMKQKLALACTLIHTPELLVLDEPTTGVDPVSRRDFWKILVDLQREGITVLLTTPYLDEAERCRRVALMDHGSILVLDAPDAIRAAAGGRIVEILARPKRQALRLIAACESVAEVESFGERVHATLRPAPAADPAEAARDIAGRLRAAGVEVLASRPVQPSLEDIFIARIREAGSGRSTRDGAVA